MLVKLINEENKTEWDRFVQQNHGSFLQSWDWGVFRGGQQGGWRFAVEDAGQWLMAALVCKMPLQLKQSVLYCPKGPIISNQSPISNELVKKAFNLLMIEIDKIAKEQKAAAFQIDPNTNDERWCQILSDAGFDKSMDDYQPRHTLILDLRLSQDEILSQMHQKTRYNINLAKKKQVEVVVDNNSFKEFFELLKKTEKRQKITMFKEQYFKNILKLPFVKLYLAKIGAKIVAANIMIFWGDTATYLFGASDYDYRPIMAPYLLQWEAMQDAKQQEMHFYDFWGAAPENAQGRESNWAGFTRFKMGFSPDAKLTSYIGTYEKAYAPVMLGIYRFLQKLRNHK